YQGKLIDDGERFQNEPGCGPAIYTHDASEVHANLTGAFEGIAPPPPNRKATLVCAASSTPTNYEWLWDGWLPRGKVVIIAGSKGDGKSTIAYNLLACMTAGGCWPDNSIAPRGSVIVWSAEDDFADTILPRFIAAGGDKRKF